MMVKAWLGNGTVGARVRAYAAATLLVAVMACNRHPEAEVDYQASPDPIPVHVKNENFLDVNIAVIVSGVSRRLGTVTGNASADFVIGWSLANGQSVVLTATPIGSRGGATSPSLSVGPGQVIEFKVGSVFRQSTATVHDP